LHQFLEAAMETTRKKGLIQRYGLLVWCALTAAAVLAVCSKSSFLYPFNDWVDANCYFTVGKGLLNGLVPYRDLVEQKGVLLYFLHGLAYLVSHTTFIGVYILEVIAGTAFLYYAAKTAALFVDERWGYILAPALAALTYASTAFAHGDSAEEFCLPLLMAGFYALMRFFKDREDLSAKMIIVCGALAGCVLWIKYTMLGFWAGWMLAVFVGLLIAKQPRRAFAACGSFLIGMAAATLPWLIYFAANGAISDWFHVYFYLNFTAYTRTSGAGEMFAAVWKTVSETVALSPALIASMAAGLMVFVFTRKLIRGVWPKVCFVLLPVLLAFGVYAGGQTYPYYFLILRGMWMLPGLIAVAYALEALAKAIAAARVHTRHTAARPGIRETARPGGHALRNAAYAAFCAAALALSVFGALRNYQYKDFMQQDKNELAQYRFAAIMNEEEDLTLLNNGFLDGGFYTAADILPTVKYFCNLNLDLPEMRQAQQQAIRDKTVDFVVVRCEGKQKEYGSNVPYLLDNYELVETVRQEFEGHNFVYCLFRVKG
jgi:hypothetical protein